MNTPVSSLIGADLRTVATVHVSIDTSSSSRASVGQILIESAKMNEIVSSYDNLFAITHKCWSNLPQAPVDEKAHVFIWMMISKGYAINHSTITWKNSTPNTFVHL